MLECSFWVCTLKLGYDCYMVIIKSIFRYVQTIIFSDNAMGNIASHVWKETF